MDELAKENHAYHHSTEEFNKIPRTMVSHLEQVRQKWVYCDLGPIFELQSLSKTVSTASKVSKLQNQFLHNKKGDGIFPQEIHGETRLIGVGGAHKNF